MWNILQHEVKYYIKNAYELIYIYGFFFLIFLLFPMGMRGELHLLHELFPSILTTAILMTISLGAMPLFQRDVESGVMDSYQQVPTDFYGMILAKWLGYYLSTSIPMLCAMPVVLALTGQSQGVLLHHSIGMLAMAAAISIIASMAAAITAGLDRARAIIMLMILPLAVPVMIFASAYFRTEAALWQPNLMFLIAYSIFLLPCYCLAAAGCLKAGN